ncbi:MAG TPA: LLM class F420-dependent oxidoreductase [Acidimicrobiales bacterium]|nr:LLM class F420-dependent oxidoreductase [Acidimicrobiales bacterium]
MQLGPVGLWAQQFRTAPRAEALAAIGPVEQLGFAAVWIPGGGTDEILDVADELLAASERIVIASGILNIWMHDPAAVAAQHQELNAEHDGRFLLGLGVSHASIVEQNTAEAYRRPLAVMSAFLDGLDGAAAPVPREERCLAALGPRMLEMARDRSAGAHPYCITPEHTRFARGVLGAGPLLAPELKAVLETDAGRARAIARAHLDRYLRQPNYANNLVRLGYAADDLADAGTDQVVDDLVAWGSAADVAERVAAHREAGADHVCIQVLTEDPVAFPHREWEELAAVLC